MGSIDGGAARPFGEAEKVKRKRGRPRERKIT